MLEILSIIAILISVILLIGTFILAYSLKSMAKIINILEDTDTSNKILNSNKKQNDNSNKQTPNS